MDTMKSTSSVASDVLHSEGHSKLSAEEIAKAISHHKKRHSAGQPMSAPAKMGSGKKNMGTKAK